MAALRKILCSNSLQSSIKLNCKLLNVPLTSRLRCLHSSPPVLQSSEQGNEPKGWFSRFGRPSAALSDQSHSMALSSKETVYEFQFHGVKPECMEDYLNQFSTFQQLMRDKGTGAELVGSFTVEIGDQDEAVHLWSYAGGYPTLDNAKNIYRTDADFKEFRKKRNTMLRYRRNQILLAFSFWPPIEPREPSHIYELRSYTLKPGTILEWGNCWAQGLKARRANNEPVMGFFTQIGEINGVEHLWAYKDLQSRKETREAAWSRPGWDTCVQYTVPLIRHMKSKILIPTPFSPLQ